MEKQETTVGQLAKHVGGTVIGDADLVITGAATLSDAGKGDVSFLSNPKYIKQLQTTQADVIIVANDVEVEGKTLIRCKDPYYGFTRAVVLLHGYREHESVGVSPRASVAEDAIIGKNVDIHDFVVVSSGAEIGENTRIYPHCIVGPGTKIGRDCLIFPNVTIYDGCKIGDRVTIHAGTVIGQDGFGYATHAGIHHKIPQIGGVVIEDDVEMGAGCAIDRGTLGNTVVGKGTKLSNLVTIGHNSQVGQHCLLVAQVGIAGSTTIGNYCVFGGQSGVIGHITLGNGCQVAAQSGVTNHLKDGAMVAGMPAMPINKAKRSMMSLQYLPEIRKKLRELDKAMQNMIKEDEE
ncbi:MAG: UDP-3-O-(3-hydroxymyristoyl)glucosamine N-acyltransferase [Phycisphaerae bacterium]|nr:UDP-3-O-(3-hydroxymyristoyl)glucosamine N-acyltransferase [Phycisphaerae bacterium]